MKIFLLVFLKQWEMKILMKDKEPEKVFYWASGRSWREDGAKYHYSDSNYYPREKKLRPKRLQRVKYIVDSVEMTG